MSAKKYDVVVLGSGPGGEGAAMQAVKSGLSVAVVDAQMMVGGNCTHWGTIPSKSLRQTIEHLNTLKKHPLLQTLVGKIDVSYGQLLKQAERSIEMQVQVRQGFYDRNDVDVFHGVGSFKDANTMVVTYLDGAQDVLVAESFVIAVGAHPYHPPDIDFEHPRIRDSNTILTLEDTPRSMIIYGAGVIGCEYASVFCNLGLRVNLINTRERLLAFLDTEICDALGYHMRDEGVVIRHEEEYENVEPLDDGVVLHLKSGKKIKADVLLWANGRTGNTHDLGLETLPLEVDSRGQLAINESYQTNLPHIYAVGDVIGFPSLASAAYNQGRFAATHLINRGGEYKLVENNPTGIYTSPEISSIGKTEHELTSENVPYEVGRAIFRNLARAQIVGVTVGILKILFHRDTQEILGIHCFGYQAAEIIHIGQVAMAHPETSNLSYFINTTFNYPTMAEAYRVAALNGLNRLF